MSGSSLGRIDVPRDVGVDFWMDMVAWHLFFGVFGADPTRGKVDEPDRLGSRADEDEVGRPVAGMGGGYVQLKVVPPL